MLTCRTIVACKQNGNLFLTPTVSLRKGPRRFCPHPSDHCRALMLTCQNSPLWQRCERCNNVLSLSWPPWLNQFNSVVITTCTLIRMSRKLPAYSYASSLALEQRLSTSLWIERYPKGRSRTRYQECNKWQPHSW